MSSPGQQAGRSTASAGRGWLPLLLLPTIVVVAVPEKWPRWGFMWLLALAIYAGVKWLTWRRADTPGVPISRQLAYLLAWPGLDAPAFLATPPDKVPRPSTAEWLFAGVKLVGGLMLLFGTRHAVPVDALLLLGWAGMVGLVFALHFGLFHLLSCFWRAQGINARPLMDWPVASSTVGEFWGRRWNTAFRDLAHRFLFRPLSQRWGARRGLAAGFLFSGLVHDAVISLPAGGGYGLPTLYFMIQALGILLERTPTWRTVRHRQPALGRLTTAVVVAAPAGLLFHPPFVCHIVLPFMQALGA